MNSINIVIPMAGAGSRFKIAGYDKPKPFIEVNGKMMIEHVLESVKVDNAIYTLIIQEQFLKENIKEIEFIKNKYIVNFITVEKVTQGASCTALAAHRIINNQDMVIFADSDNFFDNKVFNAFIKDAIKRELDGSLLTFKTSKGCFSFIKLDKNGYGIKTKEKEAISENAICGVYLFKKGSDFVNSAINMMIYGDRAKNEYYMSNVYNWAIKDTLKIGCYNIDNKDWACVGTPEQLQEFLTK